MKGLRYKTMFEQVYPAQETIFELPNVARIKELIISRFDHYINDSDRLIRLQDGFSLTESFEQGNCNLRIPFWKRVADFSNISEDVDVKELSIVTQREHAKIIRGGLAFQLDQSLEDVGYRTLGDTLARRISEYVINRTLEWGATNTPNILREDEWFDLFSSQEKSILMLHSAVFAKNLARLVPFANDYRRIFVSDLVSVKTNRDTRLPEYQSYILEDQPLAAFYDLKEIDVDVKLDDNEESGTLTCSFVFAHHLFGFDAESNTLVAEDPKNIKFWKVVHD